MQKIPDTAPLEPGDLMDLAAVSATVQVRGQNVTVYGISATSAVKLFGRFPVLMDVCAGRAVDVTPQTVAEIAPDAIASIIAAGCGHPGDQKAETVAASLVLEDQLSLLQAIVRLTMPNGIGQFIEGVGKLAETAIARAPGPGMPPKSPNRQQRRAEAANGARKLN